MRFLHPDMYVGSIKNIDIQKLKKAGIKALIFDLDNTLVPWNSSELTEETLAWFKELHKEGFKTCIVSNNNRQRVTKLCNLLEIPGIHKASKPRRKAFRRALRMLQVKPEETAMVGDQVFTDVLGAKRLGLYTILVVPISKREFIGTRINRQLEKLVLRRIKHRLIQ
ncbi:HAD superfamily phosphatase (TIGR01668 family) [Desulfohalotomaculum tongense]|uniref:YqeG family HAD IIIA-type phosphatase n=1 Tax=Desulforadius tongensis TaxID=1216062 RepID=UPI001EE6283F|nr:YqeG family HAD IIIA-type phosphatase [Desulforadius tongensis]MBM7854055.1 HAD superfamily phosphatase (TIGR01668 family) [Desulforadius tongensis]